MVITIPTRMEGRTMNDELTEALQDRLDLVETWEDEAGEETEYRKEESDLREAIESGVINDTSKDVLVDYADSWFSGDASFARAVNHELAEQGKADKLDPDTMYWPSTPPTFTHKGIRYIREA